ncbi:hypothetical protein F4805DRAFT_220056 [Annulohypoxylon moriforme]|nr:hypothetical protein F4805DRAFT_220056 [Annulohypoxylon moriforme]
MLVGKQGGLPIYPFRLLANFSFLSIASLLILWPASNYAHATSHLARNLDQESIFIKKKISGGSILPSYLYTWIPSASALLDMYVHTVQDTAARHKICFFLLRVSSLTSTQKIQKFRFSRTRGAITASLTALLIYQEIQVRYQA